MYTKYTKQKRPVASVIGWQCELGAILFSLISKELWFSKLRHPAVPSLGIVCEIPTCDLSTETPCLAKLSCQYVNYREQSSNYFYHNVEQRLDYETYFIHQNYTV